MADRIIDATCWLISAGIIAAGALLVLNLEPCSVMMAVGCR